MKLQTTYSYRSYPVPAKSSIKRKYKLAYALNNIQQVDVMIL